MMVSGSVYLVQVIINNDLVWYSQFAQGFPTESEINVIDLIDDEVDASVEMNIEFEEMENLPITGEQIQCIRVSIIQCFC